MEVTCPKCGEKVQVKGIGRKKLNISVIKVYDKLRECLSVPTAARELGCSRGYIYKALADHGATPEMVIKGTWSPPEEKLKRMKELMSEGV